MINAFLPANGLPKTLRIESGGLCEKIIPNRAIVSNPIDPERAPV